MADFLMVLAEGVAEPKSFGILTATTWVSIAMTIFIAILLWKKVPALIAGMLDNRIAEISKQLKEAEALRLDAESLKAEYEAKLADAAKEADEMRARADAEAEALVAKAKTDATALIARRKQMAEDRIAAADKALVDQAIAGVARG